MFSRGFFACTAFSRCLSCSRVYKSVTSLYFQDEPSSVYAPQLKLLRILGFIPNGRPDGPARGRRWRRLLKKLSIGNVVTVIMMFAISIHILKMFFCLLFARKFWCSYFLYFLIGAYFDGIYIFGKLRWKECHSVHQMLGRFPQRNSLFIKVMRGIPLANVALSPLMVCLVAYFIVFIPGQLQNYYNMLIFPFDVSRHVNLFSALAVLEFVVCISIPLQCTMACLALFVTQCNHWVVHAAEFRDELRNQLGSHVTAPYLKYATRRASQLIYFARHIDLVYREILYFGYFAALCWVGALLNLLDVPDKGPILETLCFFLFGGNIMCLTTVTVLILVYDDKSFYSPLIAYQLSVLHPIEDTEFAIQAEILAQLLPHLKNNLTVGGFFPVNRDGMLRIWSALYATLSFVVQNKPAFTEAVQEFGPADQLDF